MARYRMHLVLSFWDEKVRLLTPSWRGIEGRADVNICWVIIIILLDLVTEYLLSDGTWEITLVDLYHIMGTSMIFSLIAAPKTMSAGCFSWCPRWFSKKQITETIKSDE